MDSIIKPKTYLVFDLETNGIGSFRPPTQTITQLAFIKFSNTGEILDTYSAILKGATQIKNHPSVTITLDKINKEGIDPKIAIDKFLNSIDENVTLCSHNYEFDKGLIMNHIDKWPSNPSICTMRLSTDFCRLPKLGPASRYPGYKFPNLKELSTKLKIKSDETKFHDALYDCYITKECVIKGIANNLW